MMKIAISNIAWGDKNLETFLKLIKSNGCDAIELAPSLIWQEPLNSDQPSRKKIKKQLKDNGVKLVGFHSLLFNRPELKFFDGEETRLKTIDYLKKLSELCNDLGGSQVVLGSPSNRSLNGRNYKLCLNQIYDDFYSISEKCKKNNVFFCLEPLSKSMSDFITSSLEAGKIVKKINHTNLKLHLDTKTIFENNENIEKVFDEYGNYIQHFHISEPGLAEIGKSEINHKSIGETLRKMKYQKFVSIEMKNNNINAITNSINFVKNNYLN